jgi:hypothetical protein
MRGETLAVYPYVAVRVACHNCRRRGVYRLARLAERLGADATLNEVLMRITADCHLASNRTGRPGCRVAYFPDLEQADTAPPQRAPLRVILGGRHPASEE